MSEKSKEHGDDFKYIVRLANTDIDGEFGMVRGLSQIKGIGARVAGILVTASAIPADTKMGNLSDEDIEKLAALIEEIDDRIPVWMKNRPKDVETGEDLHFYGMELNLLLEDDINRMKKIRCYRGMRHEQGRKVRGQRSSSNGRRGAAIGVSRKKK